jgi:predicted nucleic acid-binding protein
MMTTLPMTTYIADSSIWIDHLRRRESALVDLLDGHEIAHTEPVATEVLAGARDDEQFDRIQRMLLGTPLVRFDSASDFTAMTELRRTALRMKLRVGLIDCMILAVSSRSQTPLVTLDRAQSELAAHLRIEARLLTTD